MWLTHSLNRQPVLIHPVTLRKFLLTPHIDNPQLHLLTNNEPIQHPSRLLRRQRLLCQAEPLADNLSQGPAQADFRSAGLPEDFPKGTLYTGLGPAAFFTTGLALGSPNTLARFGGAGMVRVKAMEPTTTAGIAVANARPAVTQSICKSIWPLWGYAQGR